MTTARKQEDVMNKRRMTAACVIIGGAFAGDKRPVALPPAVRKI